MRRLSIILALSAVSFTACDAETTESNPTSDVTSSVGDTQAPDSPQADVLEGDDDVSSPVDPVAQSDAVEQSDTTATEPETDPDTESEETGGTDSGPVTIEEDVAEPPVDPPVDPPVETSDPGEPGAFSFEVMTHTESLDIDGASVDVLCVIYMPDGDGPFPVVTFTHGFQLAPADYVSYGEQLASWGYIAVLPQLPGGLFDAPTHVQMKNYMSALLDWIEADEVVLSSKADVSRIALAGHSMGGKISLLLSTEDPRPVAVFGVDPVDAAGGPFTMDATEYPSVTPELMGSITVPLGLLGETTNGAGDGSMFGQACAPSEDNFQAYFEYAESSAIEIDVLGASHMSFLDNPSCGLACLACPEGTDDPAVSRMLAQRYMIAFFNVFVQGEASYMDYLTGDAMASDIAAELVTTQTKNNF